MENQGIIRQAENFVHHLFQEKLPRELVYHNYDHTFETVKEARALGEAYALPPDDLEALLLAAWFHDTGYIDAYLGHEEKSAETAIAWLQEKKYPEDRLALVADCILATKHGSPSQGLLQDILVDADMANTGKETFFSTAELLRVEWEVFLNKFYSDPAWAQFQLNFLLKMSYRTEQAQNKFAKQLELNIQEQRKRLGRENKKEETMNINRQEDINQDINQEINRDQDQKKGGGSTQPKRGIETMFRSTYRTHINLSAIADNKANMMISLNAIILSVIITYVGAKTSVLGGEFARNPILFVPIGTLLLTTLGSVVAAIMSAQPEVTSFTMDKNHPNKNNRSSILFFGNFTKLPLDDFQRGMKEIMGEKDSLYSNMITDIYYLGHVLNKKYRLLRVSYTIFMIGLILTVLSFIVAILLKQ